MGISSGTSTRWLFVHCVQIELEFRNVGFWGEGKTGAPGEKPLGARTTTNSTHIWRRAWEPYPGHLSGRRVLPPLRHPCSPKHSRISTLNTLYFLHDQLHSYHLSQCHRGHSSRLYGQSLLLVRGSRTRRTCDSRRNRNARFKAVAYVRLRSPVRRAPWREGGIAWTREIHLH